MRFTTSAVARLLLVFAMGVAFLPGVASADIITKALTIQVFQLCNDAGGNCTALGPAGDAYYSTEVNAIWAQAGIGVGFSFVQEIDSTKFSTIDDTVGSGHTFGDLAAAYGTHGPSAAIVDLFLVHSVAGAFGEGWLGSGGIVIGMDSVLAFDNPTHPRGRIDSVAHELGHNFGLVPNNVVLFPETDGTNHSKNAIDLMASGGIRDIPVTTADVAPNGMGWDLLPANEVAFARQSSLLSNVPEPASVVLLLTIVAGVFLRSANSRKQRWLQESKISVAD